MSNITLKIKELFAAKYIGVNWKSFGENDGLICYEEETYSAVSNFIDEFEEWESAGFPDLNNFLNKPNGRIRYKKK